MPEKLLKVSALLRFIEEGHKDGVSDQHLVEQIKLFCEGVRDVRLADRAIALIDGETTNEPQTHSLAPKIKETLSVYGFYDLYYQLNDLDDRIQAREVQVVYDRPRSKAQIFKQEEIVKMKAERESVKAKRAEIWAKMLKEYGITHEEAMVILKSFDEGRLNGCRLEHVYRGIRAS
jgi:hypothetical protein